MGSKLVAIQAPLFDDEVRFCSVPEPLQAMALAPELAVEALIDTMLTMLSRVEETYVVRAPFFTPYGRSSRSGTLKIGSPMVALSVIIRKSAVNLPKNDVFPTALDFVQHQRVTLKD